jgi:hypothetical protein
MNKLESNIALYCVAENLDEEIEDIQEIFKYLTSANKKEALNTLEKISIGYIKLQNKPMQHSFDLTEFYNELKGRDLILNGKIVEDDFDLYINNCIKNENLRFDYDFEARELDETIFFNNDINIARPFDKSSRAITYEGYRALNTNSSNSNTDNSFTMNKTQKKKMLNQDIEDNLDEILHIEDRPDEIQDKHNKTSKYL